jgi:cytochrome bd ubiquinol oxidase subunit II
MPLEVAWFLLVGVLLAGYAMLDGFDLGVGMLHPFVARTDAERRQSLHSIGPVWDGNEVWLITGGGALFAAFPRVYATVFSGLYVPLMLVLAALIGRAAAIEFRDREAGRRWRATWDVVFAVSSFLPALLFGVAVGNIVRGLPLDAGQEYAGGLAGLLHPFALLVGVLAVALFVVHGAAWLVLMTDGPVRERARAWGRRAWPVFAALWLATTVAALAVRPGLARAWATPLGWAPPALFVVAAIGARVLAGRERPGAAFAALCGAIALLFASLGVSLFPDLVPARGSGEALTVWNASATPRSLRAMLIIALTGMPLVVAYTVLVYRRFKGPVRLGEDGGHD